MRDYTERLRDIQEAIANIEKYAVRGEQVFFEDELIQVWVIHHLQIIGEASSVIPESFTHLHPEIPWQDMKDFRNLVVHEYFRVNLDTIWSITKDEIPDLKQQINQILSELESS
ncbi:MAG: DUF86 domain-containing protein [Halothece sp.]